MWNITVLTSCEFQFRVPDEQGTRDFAQYVFLLIGILKCCLIFEGKLGKI